jgi:kinesin family protein 5
MFGHDEASACDVHASVLADSSAGLAPRACATTLVELARRRQMYARGILDQEPPELWVSFVQVYGNEVTDLLAGASGRRDSASTQIGAWGGVAAAAVSAGHGEVFVNDASSLQQLLLTGERAKRRAATAMNARSSRAHTLLTLRLRTAASRRPGGKTASTRLVIADLGGCERLKKSGATESKQRMKEAININVGLLALQNCITALVEQAKHVPFADSRLTSLLASALQSAAAAGGRVAMIIAGRTDPAHAPETLRALRFGETAGQAAMGGQNVSHQADASAALAALTAELDAVEAAIAKTERWDKGKPVGAEALRERQSSLLAAQKVLCGTR